MSKTIIDILRQTKRNDGYLSADDLYRVRWPRVCASCHRYTNGPMSVTEPYQHVFKNGSVAKRLRHYLIDTPYCSYYHKPVWPMGKCFSNNGKVNHNKLLHSNWMFCERLLDDYALWLQRGGVDFRAGVRKTS